MNKIALATVGLALLALTAMGLFLARGERRSSTRDGAVALSAPADAALDDDGPGGFGERPIEKMGKRRGKRAQAERRRLAQGLDDDDMPPRGGPMSEDARRKRDEVEEKIKALRVYQLTQILDLDEATGQAFFPKLARFDEATMEARRGRRRNQAALQAALSGTVDPAEVSELIQEDVALTAREASVYTDFLTDIQATLSPEQVGQFILYQRDFEHQLRRLIRATLQSDDPAQQAAELEKLKAVGRPPPR